MSSDPAAPSFFGKLKNKLKGNNTEDPSEYLDNTINNLHKHHQISDTEFSMLQGIITFQDKMAREVMVPRTDAFMVDINDNFLQNLDAILHEPYSRVPVYDQDKDKVVGVIHIRTVLRMAREHGFDKLTYQDVMFKPLFSPETMDLSELLIEMQQTQNQLVILTDEYGGVVGLVTIEDLIEEIVGNIDDEVDQTEVLSTKLAPGKYVINGKMPLDDFNEEFHTDIQMDDVDTIAGYVITKLGMIPAKGEKLSVSLDNGMTLTTRRMRGSRLLTVLLKIPTNKKEEKTN